MSANNVKPSSAKNKGRIFQQAIRDMLLGLFPSLEKDDIRSTSMGSGGEDLQLSPAARKFLPFQIEAKSKRDLAIQAWYEQAKEHGNHTPLVVVKKNGCKPLVIMDAEWFFKQWADLQDFVPKQEKITAEELKKEEVFWKDIY